MRTTANRRREGPKPGPDPTAARGAAKFCSRRWRSCAQAAMQPLLHQCPQPASRPEEARLHRTGFRFRSRAMASMPSPTTSSRRNTTRKSGGSLPTASSRTIRPLCPAKRRLGIAVRPRGKRDDVGIVRSILAATFAASRHLISERWEPSRRRHLRCYFGVFQQPAKQCFRPPRGRAVNNPFRTTVKTTK